MKAARRGPEGAFPEFNASLSPEKDALILKKYYNIGIAVDTPDGLVVPVIKDVDRKGIIELSQEMGAISKKARDGKLGAADMQGATLHHLLARRHRRHRVHADRQRARGGDPRRRALEDGAGLERHGVQAAADAAAIAVLRSPGDRRRARAPASRGTSATSSRTCAGWSSDGGGQDNGNGRNQGSRYRRLQGRADHRDPRAPGGIGQRRRPAGHAGERQGDDGRAGAAGRARSPS